LEKSAKLKPKTPSTAAKAVKIASETNVPKTPKPAVDTKPKPEIVALKLSRIRVSKIPQPRKQLIKTNVKKIDITLQQLRHFKTKFKAELASILNKSKSSKSLINEEDAIYKELDFKDEDIIKERFKELHEQSMSVKKQNTELTSTVSNLQNRLLREQERGRLNPKVTTIVPTSLEVCFR
jgi:hypothetical protein